MKKIKNNQAGFGHAAIAIVIITVLAIFGIGYRIYHVNKTDNRTVGVSTSPDSKKDVKLDTPKQVTVSSKGSAAAQTKSGSVSSAATQTVSYDLTTPYGTIKQIEKDVKAGNYDEVAYFITPRVMFRASDTMGVPEDGDMSKIYYACTQNSACSLGLASSSLTTNFTTEDYNYGVGGTHGVVLIYNLSEVNKPAAAIYGNQQVRIYTVGYDNDQKWVVDKITVGSSTF